jgi:hypothetical protein
VIPPPHGFSRGCDGSTSTTRAPAPRQQTRAAQCAARSGAHNRNIASGQPCALRL